MKIKEAILIKLQALLFVLFLIVTCYFNRFAADDYHFVGGLRNASFNEIYQHLYFDWHGRWTSNFSLLFFLKFNTFSFFLMSFTLLSIALLYLGILLLLKAVNHYYDLKLSKNNLLVYGVIALAVLFFCTVSPGGVWMWYTASVVYFWSTIAFFFGATIFFRKKERFLDYLLFGISLVYIGGSNEPLTIFIIIGLSYLLYKKERMLVSGLGIALISLSFLINYLSPGTVKRDEITPSLSVLNLILYTGYSSLKFLLFTIYKTFIPALFLGFSFYFLGKRIELQIVKEFQPIKELLKSLSFITIAVVFNHAIVVFALGGLAPDRSGITSSIVVSIVLIRYLFLLGNHHKKKQHNFSYILMFNVFVLLLFNGYYAYIHYSYAKAVDQRISFVKKSNTKRIEVFPLPKSGYIYNAEITNDATHYKNIHLKEGLGIDGDIVLVIEP